MDYQPNFWDACDPTDNPISRSSDPETSHCAADEITGDGSRSRMMRLALEVVRANPGCTANELDQLCNCKDGAIRKRLTDLEKLGLVKTGEVRKSKVTGKMNQTWYPT